LKYLLTPTHNVNKYEQSGAYRLDCQTCLSKYVGQTGGPFKVRFKEHIQAIKGNKDASMFAQHILNTGHAYGCMEATMMILHSIGKGAHMNTLEMFHIYEITKQGKHLNDMFTHMTNPIFDTLIQASRRKQV
jgi:hypothetical protein